MSYDIFDTKVTDVKIENRGDIVSDDNTNPEFIDICTIYSYRREHESKGEQAFIDRYMKDFTPIKSKRGEIMAYKYDNANQKSDNNICWASHIDTVHRTEPERIKQDVYIDSLGTAFVDTQQDCLGADDGSGVWLMLEMIKANVFGTYIFFRGEEQGCIGSSCLAEEQEDYFKSFTHMISLDRMGCDEVITTQHSSQCCSDKFGKEFAKILGMGFKISPKGVYTDSAEFTHLIPECTNLGVGYMAQHSHRETQDLNFLVKLRDKLVSVNWATAPISATRKPEPKYSYRSGVGGWGLADDWDYEDYRGGNTAIYDYEEFAYMSTAEVEKAIKDYTPTEIADLVKFMAEDVVAIRDTGGYDY